MTSLLTSCDCGRRRDVPRPVTGPTGRAAHYSARRRIWLRQTARRRGKQRRGEGGGGVTHHKKTPKKKQTLPRWFSKRHVLPVISPPPLGRLEARGGGGGTNRTGEGGGILEPHAALQTSDHTSNYFPTTIEFGMHAILRGLIALIRGRSFPGM